MIEYALIVACTDNGGIGITGKIPWYIPEDLKNFKKITTMTINPQKINAVIMGRKTWESLPSGLLIDRINIIISNTLKNNEIIGAMIFKSLKEAHDKLKLIDCIETVFVIGGSKLYQEAMQEYNYPKIYLTNIYTKYECDTFIDLNYIIKNYNLKIKGDKLISTKSNEEYCFDHYERKRFIN
jgi:dihydrofolate reductase